jgi:hypothetical protein
MTEPRIKFLFPPRGVKIGTTYNKAMFAVVSALFGYNRRYNRGAREVQPATGRDTDLNKSKRS